MVTSEAMVGSDAPGGNPMASGVVPAHRVAHIDGGRLRGAYPSALRPTYYTVTEGDLMLSLAATFVTSVELVRPALDASTREGSGRLGSHRRWRAVADAVASATGAARSDGVHQVDSASSRASVPAFVIHRQEVSPVQAVPVMGALPRYTSARAK